MASRQIPSVFASSRFRTGYAKAAPEIRRQALLGIADILDRYEGRTPIATRQVRRVEGLSSPVWRMKLNDAARMLYHRDNSLTLLDVGDHDVTERYTDARCKSDIRSRTPANDLVPRAGDAESVFAEALDELLAEYDASELTPEWLYFLDDEQHRVADGLLGSALAMGSNANTKPAIGASSFHFVIGGPGTGKTSILVNLLDMLRAHHPVQVRLVVADPVADFLRAHLPFAIDPYLAKAGDFGDGRPRVVLVDDPGDISRLGNICEMSALARNQLVVAAFDPLQLDKSLTDAAYKALLKKYKAVEHRIVVCYRQRRNVGKATARIARNIADSTPFLDATKSKSHRQAHRALTTFANEAAFPNPHGYVATHVNATAYTVQSELERLAASPGLWTHWPYLLVAVDDWAEGASRAILKILPASLYSRPLREGRIREASLQDPLRLKGTEYQHVFVMIGTDLYRQVDKGFSGTGKRVYEQRRLLRIPFSRARDSLVTFAVGRGT